ncbi:MAG: phosphatidylglycerol lysyltransferase domain-containing protein, partial [Pseudomonadota bacterium]|nr:phosphatidylglycerol lysyltransferase domain-containing protein [Pseudomonadota bacterium]
LGTDIRSRSASRAGVCAIAFSQTIGFGLLTGSFARWRLLRGLSPAVAAKLTGFVAITFLGALGFVVSLVWLVVPLVPGFALLAWCGLALSLGLGAMAFLRPVAHFGALRLPLPSLPAIGAMATWAIVDTFAACIALLFLIPDQVALTLSMLLPAFLLALGVALLSGTPAGVGPFELTLLMLLPTVPAESLVAGIVAFRAVYYLAPALIAGAVLLFVVPLRTSVRHIEAPAPTGPFPGDLARAETQVIRQNGGRVVGDDVSRIAVVSLPQVAVGLFDPVGGDAGHAIRRVIDTARRENRVACLYKCSGQTAARARRDGWLPVRIAREALLFPPRFSLDTPARRQLRRKIRQAEKVGIRVERAGPVQPVDDMARVDAEWQARQGRARGTTMGRYDRYYVACQIVFLAWQGEDLAGFASFHETPRE